VKTVPKFKTQGITVQLKSKMKKELERIAAEHEMSQSEFLRYLLQKYIESEANQNK
jgi:metal-responsive CopG/Arc/MetJ family transcriptional regulator